MIGIFNSARTTACRRTPAASAASTVHLRENCVRRHPAPPRLSCSVATTNLADRVAEPGAARASPSSPTGFGMAEAGPIFPPAGGVISGSDPRRGGAASSTRSSSALTGGAGGADAGRLADHCPCRQRRHVPPRQRRGRRAASTRSGSTSAGSCPTARAPARFRGAPGVRVEFGPVDGCRMRHVLHRRRHGQRGRRARAAAAGGGPVRAVQAHGRRHASTPQPACAGVELAPGETIVSVSSRRRRLRAADCSAIPSACATTCAEGYVSPPRGRSKSMAWRSTSAGAVERAGDLGAGAHGTKLAERR